MKRYFQKMALALVLTALIFSPLVQGNTYKEEPTIMVIIPEVIIRQPTPDPAVETAIIHQLVEKGFKVVDEKQIDKIRDKKETKLALEGNEEALMELGSKFKVDILVLGEAFAEDTGTSYGLQTVRARAEVRIVRSKDAVILGSKGVQVGASDLGLRIAGKKGLQRAGKKVSQYVVNKLAKEVDREELMTGGDIIVEISPISFSDLSTVKDTFRMIEDIESFRVENYSTAKQKAIIAIESSSGPYEVTELLTKIPYGYFYLQLSSINKSGADTVIQLRKEG